MNHRSTYILLAATLVLVLAPVTVVLAVDYTDPNDYPGRYRTPYNGSTYTNPYNGSSSNVPPLNRDLYGNPKFDDPSRKQQPRYDVQPSAPVEPPAGAHDFNVWKDGKPTLCTATKYDTYCY